MAIPFLSPIDLNRNELQNFRVQNLAAAPTHAPGLAYFDTVLGQLGISTGSAWVYLSVSAALDTEAVQDIVGAMGSSSSVITATYNDPAGTISYTIAPSAVTNTMLAGSISADKIIDGASNHVFSVAEQTKLTGIATGATANATDATLLARVNHTGTQSADTLTAGATNKLYVAADVTKLAGISTGATANATDALLRDRTTHTGTQSADTLTSGTTNKLYVQADVTKLAGIAAGATANSTDVTLLARANHTGTQSADTILDGTTNKVLSAAMATKLNGVAAGATANSTDAVLLARANHTGTQVSTTISDFNAAVNALIAATVGAAPAALDTLVELASALGNDANFAATMTTNLGLKANTASLSPVATAGTYASITGKPSYNVPVGDGVATTYVITHNLNSQNVDVDLRLTLTPFTLYQVEVRNTSVNTITLVFGAAPTANLYTVIVTAV